MTKDIKKKRKIDWIVFWIWILTAVVLYASACEANSVAMKSPLHRQIAIANDYEEDDPEYKEALQKIADNEKDLHNAELYCKIAKAAIYITLAYIVVGTISAIVMVIRGRSDLLKSRYKILSIVNLIVAVVSHIFIYL